MEHLQPVRDRLRAGLEKVLVDQGESRTESERQLAANILAGFARDQYQVLADLLMKTGEKQFEILYAALAVHGERAVPVLNAELDKTLSPAWSDMEKERLAKRQANAAVALARLKPDERIWTLLKHRPDCRVRSWLIHRFAACGGDPRALVQRFAVEQDVSVRRALILALGEFPADRLSADERAGIIEQLVDLYQRDPDPGLHGAADWLPRQWGQGERISRLDEALAAQTVPAAGAGQGVESPSVRRDCGLSIARGTRWL